VIQLPETLRPAIGSVGQAALFGKDGAVVAARLRQLSDSADRLTRTFEARYVLEGELAQAPLGATVTIRLPQAQSDTPGGVQVPIGALFDAGKGPGVWVIAGEPSRVSWRPVTVRRLDDDSARVAGQLRQGERIVALGAHLLREGEQVRVAVQPPAVASVAGGAVNAVSAAKVANAATPGARP
jgi:multidrug efflux pump subunit AcrA (membrane-fusion protein)